MSLTQSSHPIVREKIARLRSVETPPSEFRRLVRSLAYLLAFEALADVPLKETSVTTPMGTAPGVDFAGPIVIVPILRAGLGMADGVLDLLPDAEVWHLGLRRNETTLEPEEYYRRLPQQERESTVVIVDPMLATGGSAAHACRLVRKFHPGTIRFIAIISAPEGIKHLQDEAPGVAIHVGVIDEKLNSIGYIYPGLGDAGDRQFATFEV